MLISLQILNMQKKKKNALSRPDIFLRSLQNKVFSVLEVMVML